jgi:hypothetical protein
MMPTSAADTWYLDDAEVSSTTNGSEYIPSLATASPPWPSSRIRPTICALPRESIRSRFTEPEINRGSAIRAVVITMLPISAEVGSKDAVTLSGSTCENACPNTKATATIAECDARSIIPHACLAPTLESGLPVDLELVICLTVGLSL